MNVFHFYPTYFTNTISNKSKHKGGD